jgi:O-antigen ligase
VTVAVVLVLGDTVAKRTVLVAAALLALLGGTALAASVQGQSVKRITSDRSRRANVTFDVFKQHPLVGVGIGGHPAASVEIAKRNRRKADYVSHTTPLTIAAELGVVGLLVYAALLGGAAVLFHRVRRVDEALGVGLGAVFLALFVHSLFYGGFFEDPVAWLSLAIGSAVLVAARSSSSSPAAA